MSWLTQLIRPKIRSLKKQDLPENLWEKCLGCEQMIFHKDLSDNLFVCKHCGYHFCWDVKERLKHLFDDGSYQVIEIPATPIDPIGFRDQKRYTDRLRDARQKTGSSEAVIVAFGKINHKPVVSVCFNFGFIGGSMGMAVGEALIVGAKFALEKRAAFLTIPSSGGARMQEGALALMQMPRSIIAIQLIKESSSPVITLMTHPTTGGVAASFASLGDITLAEPGAIIGFTGARVIQETLRKPLPMGFQTTEFQKQHGFVDMITPRNTLRPTLDKILKILCE